MKTEKTNDKEFEDKIRRRGAAMHQVEQIMEGFHNDPGGQLKVLSTILRGMDVEGVTEILKEDPLLNEHDAVRKIFMTRDLLASAGW